MTTEQYSIGYDAGYQDGFDAALAEPVKQEPVAWAYIDADGSFMDALDRQHGAYQTPLYAAPVSAEPCKECDAKQAKIDSLMLEYCPDEITDEQMTEWSANQKPVSECRHCGWLCMPNDSHSKKWYPMQEPVKQEPVAIMSPNKANIVGINTPYANIGTDDWIKLYAAPQPMKQEPVAYFLDVKAGFSSKPLYEQVSDEYKNDADVFPLYAAPVSVEAIRSEALEEAEEIAKTIGGSFSVEFLAAIRELK